VKVFLGRAEETLCSGGHGDDPQTNVACDRANDIWNALIAAGCKYKGAAHSFDANAWVCKRPISTSKAPKSDTCFKPDENEQVTLRGTIVQSSTIQKNDATGESASTKFMAIALALSAPRSVPRRRHLS
jgi:hypothetical protein